MLWRSGGKRWRAGLSYNVEKCGPPLLICFIGIQPRGLLKNKWRRGKYKFLKHFEESFEVENLVLICVSFKDETCTNIDMNTNCDTNVNYATMKMCR